jgi:hypothetical protein
LDISAGLPRSPSVVTSFLGLAMCGSIFHWLFVITCMAHFGIDAVWHWAYHPVSGGWQNSSKMTTIRFEFHNALTS